MNTTILPLSLILTLFVVTPISAQKRSSRQRERQPARPVASRKANTPATRPRLAQPLKPLPLVPEYEYEQNTGITRVLLNWSPVEEQSGANNVRFYVRYVYAKDWMQFGTQNDVLLGFAINTPKGVCSEDCVYTLFVDDYEQPVRATSQATKMADGTINETITRWMPPKVFKKITEAQKIRARIGSVTLRLSDSQIEGMRQMVPFLRFRPFFN